MRCLFLLCLSLFVVFSSACAGTGKGPAAEIAEALTDSPLRDAVPPLDKALPPLAMLHEAAGLIETRRDGVDTHARSSSAVDVDPVLQLSAAAGELSWAIWSLPAVDELRYLDVSLQLPDPDGQSGGVYLALADYSNMNWDIEGPLASGRVLELDPALHSSPGGNLYAAVLVYDNDEALVQELRLISFHSNAAPTAALSADPASGAAPLLVEFDASASSDPDAGDSIVRYHWDWDGDGVFDGSSFSPLASHLYLSDGNFSATVAAEDRDGENDSAVALIQVIGNQAPTALIETNRSSGAIPLTIDFDAGGSSAGEATDSLVNYEWDFDGDGLFDGYGDSPLASLVYLVAGDYSVTLRVTDGGGLRAVDTIVISVSADNIDPIAALDIDPEDVPQGGEFTMDASQSSDSDGSIVLYEWDTDGNGSFDTNSGAASSIAATCDIAGPRSVGVRVTDNSGGSGLSTVPLQVRGWYTVTPDSGTPAIGPTTLLEVEGSPAIAFIGSSPMYIRAADADGITWNAALQVAGGGLTQSFMAIINSRPALCFVNEPSGDLLFERAEIEDGSDWSAGALKSMMTGHRLLAGFCTLP
jgi:PKD repeat protein